MQLLLEFLPLVAFLVAYKVYGIYVATATLMVGMVLSLLVLWARSRKLPAMFTGIAAFVGLCALSPKASGERRGTGSASCGLSATGLRSSTELMKKKRSSSATLANLAISPESA